MKLKDIGEIGLIKRISRKVRTDKTVIKGIGDDTAVIRWKRGKYLLLTCDMLVEGVHFKAGKASPYEIGWKALARNISDIAAMGGVPRYALVSVGLDPDLPVNFLDKIYKGLTDLAKRFGINIVGGDTARSEKLIIDVSLAGEVEDKNLVLRSGAREGDLVLITGSIGGSIKGKHLIFMPRLNEARQLVRNFKVNSMIDISDGLALDLGRILEASRVGARIYKNAIPLSKEAGSVEKAIREGEDFELLFTMSAGEAKRFFKTALEKIGVDITLIGEVTDRRGGYKMITEDGRKVALAPEGYLHF